MRTAAAGRRCWILGLGLLLGVLFAIYAGILLRYRLAPAPLLAPAAQDQVIDYLRAALSSQPSPAAGSTLKVSLPGPAWITLYHRGEVLLRHSCQTPAASLLGCLEESRRAIAKDPNVSKLTAADRREVRIKVDLTIGRGPIISTIPIAFAKSLVPGLDGIGLTLGQRSAYLLPDDLFRKDLLAGYQPFYFMPEFQSGLDLQAVIDQLADQLEVTAEAWREQEKSYFRFRVQSFVDRPGGRGGLPVLRSRVPVNGIDRQTVRKAVERAADYVLRQIREDGSFEYIYYPVANAHSLPGNYSLPRHAGTTWFLSLAYKVLKEERFKAGAERAINYLGAHAVPPECQKTPYACIGSGASADLGSAALGVVAIAEYQDATADQRFLSLARRLGVFITSMQKDNGDFCHQFKPSSKQKNCQDILLYYSGEAALALAKLRQITGDASYDGPLERALDFLTDENYDFLLGKFFIGEDHWTCIAAEAAYEVVNKDQYAEFCYAFGRLNGRAQVQPGEGLMDDLQGAFTVTPFFMPHNTPAGSRSEANIATYLLSQKRGEPQADILRIIRLAMRYLVDQQIRPESAYLLPDPAMAVGGMMQTPQRASVRIDFVQHAAAAMARSLPLIPERWWTP